jgi:hypothetical protein
MNEEIRGKIFCKTFLYSRHRLRTAYFSTNHMLFWFVSPSSELISQNPHIWGIGHTQRVLNRREWYLRLFTRRSIVPSFFHRRLFDENSSEKWKIGTNLSKQKIKCWNSGFADKASQKILHSQLKILKVIFVGFKYVL